MKRIALVASTENIFRIKELFEDVPVQIDFIIFNKNFKSGGQYDFGQFTKQSMLIEDTMIPMFESAANPYTALQAERLKSFSNEISNLKRLIIPQPEMTLRHSESFSSIIKSLKGGGQKDNKIYLTEQIKDIVIDEKTGRIRCEMNQSELLDYDHLLLENNDRIFEFVRGFCPNHFRQTKQSSFQFVGMHFVASDALTNNHFWFVDDYLYESLYDNVYFMNCRQAKLDCWTWIPEQQLRSVEYFRFISQRIRNRIEEKFNFLSISLASSEFWIQPLNSAQKFSISQPISRPSPFSAFPHFNFLGEVEVKNLFWNEVEKLNKKLQFYVPPKEKDLVK